MFTRAQVQIPSALNAKWPGETLAEGFVPFPKTLLRSMDAIFCDAEAIDKLRVILSIVDFARPNLSRNPSIAYLAFTAGMSPLRYEELVRKLADDGLITWNESILDAKVEIEGLVQKIRRVVADRDKEEEEAPRPGQNE